MLANFGFLTVEIDVAINLAPKPASPTGKVFLTQKVNPGPRSRACLLSRHRQYSAREGMPERRDADRPVQEFYGDQRDAAIDINRMRTATRAPVVEDGDHQQQIGDEGRRDG